MKRFLLIMLLILISMNLFTQDLPFTVYGSLRMGFWYEYRNEDHYPAGESHLRMNYFLQPNSRLGINFRHQDFDGKIEVGINANPGVANPIGTRFLYGRQKFGNWSLLAGQDAILGTDFLPNQAGGPTGELALIGYGLAWGGRVPQVRFEMDNGLFAAFILPAIANDPIGNQNAVDTMFPRINFGYRANFNGIKITPAAVFQMYDYNSDLAIITAKRDVWNTEENDYKEIEKTYIYEQSVMSWIGVLTAEMNFNPILVNFQLNYGSNIGNMGYSVANNYRAEMSPPKIIETFEEIDGVEKVTDFSFTDHELADVTTLGGILTVTFTASETLNLTLGAGYTSSEMEAWTDPDTKMSAYLQTGLRFGRLRVTPEIGVINEMKSYDGKERGMLMYFGTQLRYDF